MRTDRYPDYIKGKSVAVVGRSQSPLGKGRGEEIDSYDVVLRLNYPLPHSYTEEPNRTRIDPQSDSLIPPEYQEDLGKRTSVFTTNCNAEMLELSDEKDPLVGLLLHLRKTNCDFITSAHPDRTPFKHITEVHGGKIREYFRFHVVEERFWLALEKELDSRPYSGTTAVAELLAFGAREIFVTGFTFNKLPAEADVVCWQQKQGIHSPNANLQWLAKAERESGVIKTDEVLTKMLDIHDSSRGIITEEEK